MPTESEAVLQTVSGDTPFQESKSTTNDHRTTRSLIQPSALALLSHPFGETLKDWEKGVAVDCGVEWPREVVDLAVERGAHPTARTPEAIKLVHKDVAYQVKAGFTEVIHWDVIKHALPEHLKISPVAVIPQKDWQGRIILDLSFLVRRSLSCQKRRRMGHTVAEAVNETSRKLTPTRPVQVIAEVLPCLFHFMAAMPADQEIHFSKVDLSDCF